MLELATRRRRRGIDVTQMLTMHLGPDVVLLALKVAFRPTLSVGEVEEVTNRVEVASPRSTCPRCARSSSRPTRAATCAASERPREGDGAVGGACSSWPRMFATFALPRRKPRRRSEAGPERPRAHRPGVRRRRARRQELQRRGLRGAAARAARAGRVTTSSSSRRAARTARRRCASSPRAGWTSSSASASSSRATSTASRATSRDVHFACIDYAPPPTGAPPNVAGLAFREEEGSFLVGAVAGLMSKTGNVGFVGGMRRRSSASSRPATRRASHAVVPDCMMHSALHGDDARRLQGPGEGQGARDRRDRGGGRRPLSRSRSHRTRRVRGRPRCAAAWPSAWTRTSTTRCPTRS